MEDVDPLEQLAHGGAEIPAGAEEIGDGLRVGSYGPTPWTVPSSAAPPPPTPQDRPAASLRRKVAMIRRDARWAGYASLAAAGLGVLAVILAFARDSLVWAGCGVVLLVAAVLLGRCWWRRPPWQLRAQVRAEEIAARALRALPSMGWYPLHDRLLPGTGHRLAHVVVGPNGVYLVTPLMPGQLGVSGEWVTTRLWEIDRLAEAISAHLVDAVWQGPVIPIIVPLPRGNPHRVPIAGVVETHRYPVMQCIVPALAQRIVHCGPSTLTDVQVRHLVAAITGALTPAFATGPDQQRSWQHHDRRRRSCPARGTRPRVAHGGAVPAGGDGPEGQPVRGGHGAHAT